MIYTATELPWWTLSSPTVDGRRVLSCHYPTRHDVARVADSALVLCSSCRRRIGGLAWCTPTRELVLCGRCHETTHADERATAAAAPVPEPKIPGQTEIELP